MIPNNLLPKTLKIKIMLDKVGKIEFLHKRSSQFYINGHVFMKSYIPSMRYYSALVFDHKIGRGLI